MYESFLFILNIIIYIKRVKVVKVDDCWVL